LNRLSSRGLRRRLVAVARRPHLPAHDHDVRYSRTPMYG